MKEPAGSKYQFNIGMISYITYSKFYDTGIGPERASLRNLSLEAKENRLFARELSVEVSKIPGLSRSSSMEK